MLPGLKDAISGLFKGGLSGVSDLISNFKLSPEKAGEFELQKQELLKQIQLKQMELEQQVVATTLAETQAYLADVQNSRAMQIEALKQDDKFSKRFIYYFTILLTVIAFTFDMMFFFVQYPERNHDIINMIAGVINTVCLASIVSFFYGSSKGSKEANEAMRTQLQGSLKN